MSYIWEDFNIKTFAAETIVFRDGVFCPELSTLGNPVLDKNYDLPVHYIYVGELIGKNTLDINIGENVKNQKIFLSVNVNINRIADFDILIKNSGMDSDLNGFIVLNNRGNLKFDINAHHLCRKTGILLKTRLVAYKNSTSKLSGTAHMYKYCEDCRSDLDFSAMAEQSAKIQISPIQRIASVPESASHSANIFEMTRPQIEYLNQSGLSDTDVQKIMHESFTNNSEF